MNKKQAAPKTQKPKWADTVKVINIMSDGTVLDSLKGVEVPAGHPIYALLRGLPTSAPTVGA